MLIDLKEEMKKIHKQAREINEEIQEIDQRKQVLVNEIVKLQGIEGFLFNKMKEEKEGEKEIEKDSDNTSVDSVPCDTVPCVPV